MCLGYGYLTNHCSRKDTDIKLQGYWKNKEATDDAITEQDGLRYFKTGDVGFQDKNNNFYITDRVKELIKYKGLSNLSWATWSRC
jgi:long-subunit acyl-CoA synthetase (AMP-forming)